MFFNDQEIIAEEMMLPISQLFSLEPRMKCRGGIVIKSAYKDVLAFLKLKRSKEQVQLSSLTLIPEPLEEDSMLLSTQPSAPPIPDSPSFHSPLRDSSTAGIKENLLGDFEVDGEQVDCKGMGLVDKMYVPWLEKVCQIHPSLIECQRNRTPKYAGWAFTALGRVLHFLETTKVEEMNEEACECLQLLWDEVQVFGFDLSWLAPQVEFALNNMKGYVDKMSKVNKLKEEKRSLEMIIQELSMELIETEKEMESSKGDLAKLRVESGRLLGFSGNK